jgi:serine/threonine protein kinase
MAERLDQLEILYNEALALPAAERPAFLDRVCGNDTGLRRELTSLLGYEQKAERYLNTSAMNDVAESLAKTSGNSLMSRMLGRYQLLSLVGRGGMGEVYCAVDTRLNRLVAVKILPLHLAGDPEWLHRFEREARAVAALNDLHICTLHDIGNDDQTHYIVFEYLVGELLSDRLSRGNLSLDEAMECSTQIGKALVHAHEQGILHLDLKPQNIMLTRTGVKLFDFGIAVLTSTDPSVSKAGTPGYLAPEQREGATMDPRTDIFSFGLVMRDLFAGHSVRAIDSLIVRCVANNPSERWKLMTDVVDQLKKIAAKL